MCLKIVDGQWTDDGGLPTFWTYASGELTKYEVLIALRFKNWKGLTQSFHTVQLGLKNRFEAKRSEMLYHAVSVLRLTPMSTVKEVFRPTLSLAQAVATRTAKMSYQFWFNVSHGIDLRHLVYIYIVTLSKFINLIEQVDIGFRKP